jgi:hypothetical protein
MNFGALWGLASVSGVGPLPPWRQFEVLEGARPGTAATLARAVGASRVVVGVASPLVGELEHAGYASVARDSSFAVLAPAQAPPLAFLAARTRVVSATDAVNAARAGVALEPDVLVEGDAAESVEEGDAAGRLDAVRVDRSRYEARVVVTRPTWLVLRQPYYRGWRAWIDGRPAPVRPAGGFLLGVRVETGAHDVVVAYTERGLAVGAVVSFCTLAGLVIVLRRRATVEKAGPLA